MRPHGGRIWAAALALVAALSTLGAAPALGSAAPRAGQPAVGRQRLALLTDAVTAYAGPNRRSAAVGRVARRRPITGERTALPVISTAIGSGGSIWLEVLLPGRPNSHTGWIPGAATRAGATGWRLRVSLGARRVVVFRDGRRVRSFTAVVGKPSTPTPTGRFFVEETVALGRHAVGAPYALALSARSNVLQEFAGGPGQIALHGLGNVGGVPGTAASHGCLRLGTAAITWLANRLGPGTPVSIAA